MSDTILTKEEFEKIIATNPEAKFKVIGKDSHFFDLGQIITFESHRKDGGAWFWNEFKSVRQILDFNEIEPIAASVTLKPKLTIPCCIKTSEIKDEDTLGKVVKLFEENGAKACESNWYTLEGYTYYGINWGKEAWFWNHKETYSENDNENEVFEYTLKDLFPETEDTVATPVVEALEDTIQDSSPWIEWDCANGLNPPVGEGTVLDIKWRNGQISIGLGYRDDSVCETTRYMLNTWGEALDSTVVAYRLHNSAPVAHQEATSEVLVEDSTKATIGLKDDIRPYVEPFKVVKHSYYDVTIQGGSFRITKEEANSLCTMLIEAIGEEYEPS